ncbi:MAG: tRNA uridine-5-carboxymethylaminomethyl(34) synthesis GTPase MnmE [Oscillospiraceae bacterium]|nr:tRNA uridine-5-carboxymethylaminomethyl(34) synthesis GTPase MnmE [Oscillospiraceae bacterium]
MYNSTICAIATPAAVGGISVIRISGERAFEVAERVFKPASGKPISEMRGYTAAYGKIYDNEERLDDGVLLVFKAPHSYTGEDVCEISCHGGIYVTRRVLTACLKAGAEPAAAGEFTKRALLNGKMSLTQAEAVADIIAAQGGQMLSCTNTQREGALYRRCEKIADMIMEILSQIAAWIDYPDDDTPAVTRDWLVEKIGEAQAELDDLLAGYDRGRMLRDGISCAIVGKPNVGKSTIMNLLSGSRRSIVSDIEGTTRDIVEESVNIGGVVLLLSDCAGIRETEDEVEKIGVELMLEKLNNADIVLAVFDGSRELSDEDRRLFELLKNKKVLAVVNKSDLENRLDIGEVKAALNEGASVTELSAKDEKSAEVIGRVVMERLELSNFSADAGFIANERQRACVFRASDELHEAHAAAMLGVTPDAIGVSLERALDSIYELSGKQASDEVINEVFKRFCVGK